MEKNFLCISGRIKAFPATFKKVWKTARAIADAATRVKFFWIDDVWVTGYIARHLNITHLDISKFWTMQSKQLLLYKSVQNPTIYHEDFVSGPMDRDEELSLALHRRATWCYNFNCYNNIYREQLTDQSSQLLNFNVIKKLETVVFKENSI